MINQLTSLSLKAQLFVTESGRRAFQVMRKEDGVTAIEYAVIAVAVSGMLLTLFGSQDAPFLKAITDKFTLLADNIKQANP
ncbi:MULTISPECIES: Flp family type IVb pilin [Tatumella]|uniref:Flp family type IVb pilin n=1 Tax=Tatumella punctata TaxID=399969 RepID=A0ABW1VTJ6_9GAMM|nr:MULTISPECIES: Flp family type IVb pilin [unclassified Tatumella]MBS0855883.1 Flp family type IVb pilin [Tatumella sp. JGM16]MBS0876993.1 Flp family type IVb pilin [Tatumella sp. JGM82]MBS0890870.1 Flp family type IVb pilin [Tatumella sp. JGM94]MBS0893581.1 Flp family type IVb pilin [Tatumella sp. JGM130]MBS0901885.1 Flp family type IVb pilin [Tatumella sp. JGM100]